MNANRQQKFSWLKKYRGGSNRGKQRYNFAGKQRHRFYRRAGWILPGLVLFLACQPPVRQTSKPPGVRDLIQKEVFQVATFNVRHFSKNKLKKNGWLPLLARVVQRFDLTAIQEIRGKTKEPLRRLTRLLNQSRAKFAFVLGPRQGRTKYYKELFGYVYRRDKLYPRRRASYPGREINRPPLGVRFGSRRDPRFEFTILNFHLAPKRVTTELKALERTVAWARRKFGTGPLIVAGDFNTDCSYYNESKLTWHTSAAHLSWLTDNRADTNVAPSSCTYDRLAIDYAHRHLAEGPARVLPFDRREFFRPPGEGGVLPGNDTWRDAMAGAWFRRRHHRESGRGLAPRDLSDHFPLVMRLRTVAP